MDELVHGQNEKFIENRLSYLLKDQALLHIVKIQRMDDASNSKVRNDQFWDRVSYLSPYLSMSFVLNSNSKVVIFPGKLKLLVKPFVEEIERIFEDKVIYQITGATIEKGHERLLPYKLSNPEWVSTNTVEVIIPRVQENKLFITFIDNDEVIQLFLQDHLIASDWDEIELDLEWFRDAQSFFNSGRLEKKGKHLVILDGVLQKMDGLKVLKWIRERYEHNLVEVVMISKSLSDQEIVQAFEIGAFDYIKKPFKIEEVLARLKRTAKRMLV
ncbi:response regulator transcription factor [Jeotgalibacillus soli]|uniref:Response regulatory domain-containing protein n=1 Tax=Jeotgalibacillus soli TaxID=889306 RepID=A0A0C2VRZ1_9BACL|nr:response regulator [Jeotgalibacillus soli]KIL47211.1 hypothetical protein KP78_17840 [Jeotgalibacillus soli]